MRAGHMRSGWLAGFALLACLPSISFGATANGAENESQPANSPLVAPGWPRVHKTEEGGTVSFYLPQVTQWTHREGDIDALAAVAYTPKKGAKQEYGSLQFDAKTQVDHDTRQVDLTEIRVRGGSFPDPFAAKVPSLRGSAAERHRSQQAPSRPAAGSRVGEPSKLSEAR